MMVRNLMDVKEENGNETVVVINTEPAGWTGDGN